MTTHLGYKTLSSAEILPHVILRDYLKKNGSSDQLIKESLSPEITTSVVIPVYNEVGVIEKALQALNEQSCHSFEVIIVDNESKDETPKNVESFKEQANYPLYLIKEPNPGVANARKRGIDEVLRRLLERNREFRHFLAVTDADTVPPRDWIEKITKGFNCDRIGGLAGTHEASKEVEKRIQKLVGIRNYFNIIPSLIEFLEKKGIGEIKMSGPNSAFTSVAYAAGGGIKQELNSYGRPKLSEVNNLGNRIKQRGYVVAPMYCRVIKNRRRELFEIISNGKNSYFPKDFSVNGRFNVIREDEMELLDIACRTVPRTTWENYRHKMVRKVVMNFVFRPLVLGKIKSNKAQEIFTPEEIEFFLANHSFLPSNQHSHKVLRNFLSRLEKMLQV